MENKLFYSKAAIWKRMMPPASVIGQFEWAGQVPEGTMSVKNREEAFSVQSDAGIS